MVSGVAQVYPVDGGMEDWSYAAGFEHSPRPITVCQPTTYGGYPEDCDLSQRILVGRDACGNWAVSCLPRL